MIENLALVRAELPIDAGDQLARAGAWLVQFARRFDRLPTEPLRRSRALFGARFPALGVRQLIGDLGKIDLEVVNQDIVHSVVLIRLQLIKALSENLSRAVRRMG